MELKERFGKLAIRSGEKMFYGTGRRLAIGLLAMGLAVTASTRLAIVPAHADAPSTFGIVSAGFPMCDSWLHTMKIGGFITLSDRFPSGHEVWSRYAYWTVDSQGISTGNYTVSSWTKSWANPSTTYVNDISTYTVTNQASSLPELTVYRGGQWHVAVQVALWNGSSWEYGQDYATGYGLYGMPNASTSPLNVCYASMT